MRRYPFRATRCWLGMSDKQRLKLHILYACSISSRGRATRDHRRDWTDFIEWLTTNPWFSILMLVFAVLGFLSVFIVYFKTKKARRPCYAVSSYNIFTDVVSEVESLEVSYAGKQVGSLTSTKVLFWNKGRETIRKDDLAPSDTLKLETEGEVRILDAKILHQKNPANRFHVPTPLHTSMLPLAFDFVDRDEGVVIQLLHTGRSSMDIRLTGTVMGAGSPIRKRVYPRSVPDFLVNTKRPFLYGALSELSAPLLMFVFWLGIAIYSVLLPEKGLDWGAIMIIGGMAFLALGITLARLIRRVPRGFEVFYKAS